MQNTDIVSVFFAKIFVKRKASIKKFVSLSMLSRNVLTQAQTGGATQIRTGGEGVADLCLTTWLWRRWSGLRGSNSLPPPWQGGALPDELNPHILLYAAFSKKIPTFSNVQSFRLKEIFNFLYPLPQRRILFYHIPKALSILFLNYFFARSISRKISCSPN